MQMGAAGREGCGNGAGAGVTEPTSPGRPGIAVALAVAHGADGALVRVRLGTATGPVRLQLSLDGDLVDAWIAAGAISEVRAAGRPGRHVVTVRAIDADGRWGGASALVELGRQAAAGVARPRSSHITSNTAAM